MKLALEKNKEEEKEKKDKEDEKTKATEKENEAKEKFRQKISDEVSKTVGAEVVKALKTIARAKMLRSTFPSQPDLPVDFAPMPLRQSPEIALKKNS